MLDQFNQIVRHAADHELQPGGTVGEILCQFRDLAAEHTFRTAIELVDYHQHAGADDMCENLSERPDADFPGREQVGEGIAALNLLGAGIVAVMVKQWDAARDGAEGIAEIGVLAA